MIEYVAETGSTNDDLAARLTAGDPVREGDWYVADRQLAGHGRLGREWHGGAGNYMGSTIVRPGQGDPPAPSLSLLAGLAVIAAIGEAAVAERSIFLKWPNDVMVGEAKLAGILLHAVAGAVVVGIGVNLASVPVLSDRRAVSLADLGVATEREAFADRLAGAFDRELERWRTAGLPPLLRRWCGAAHIPGTPLAVSEPGEGTISGVFAGLDANGALQLRLADGTVRTVHAGDVILSPSAASKGS